METANPQTPFNRKCASPLTPNTWFSKTSSTKGSLSSCISELSLAVVGEPAVVGELGDERTFALELQQDTEIWVPKRVIFFRCGSLVDPILLPYCISSLSLSIYKIYVHESYHIISSHISIPAIVCMHYRVIVDNFVEVLPWTWQSQRLIKLERSHWVPKMGCRHDTQATSNRSRYSKINNPEDTRCQQNVTHQDTTNLNKHYTTKYKKHEKQEVGSYYEEPALIDNEVSLAPHMLPK